MIATRQLTFAYPGSAPLQFADLNAPQGSLVLLSGPSGCGKSTWLALVAALVRASSGELTVAGQDLGTLRGAAADAWRASTIGFLPQKLHLSAALTVEQNLAMAQWAAARAHDRQPILSTLALLGVDALAHRKPAQLSGGQAQRVALARAVLHHPQVLLADEPTASLDDETANDAVDLLLSTAQNVNATLVIATHDRRVSERIQAGPRSGEVITMKLRRPEVQTTP